MTYADNAIVDMSISVPLDLWDPLAPIFVSEILVSEALATISISVDTGGGHYVGIASATVESPVPYRLYALTSVIPGVFGFVMWGSACEAGRDPVSGSFDAHEGQLLESLITRYPRSGIGGFEVSNELLSGEVLVTGSNGILAQILPIYFDDIHATVPALVFSLNPDIQTMLGPIAACDMPTESGSRTDLVTSINGVVPDQLGNVNFYFTPGYDFIYNPDGSVATDASGVPLYSTNPLINMVPTTPGELTFEDHFDFTVFCSKAVSPLIESGQQNLCNNCTTPDAGNTTGLDNADGFPIYFAGASIVGHILTVYWAFSAQGVPVVGQDPVGLQVNLVNPAIGETNPEVVGVQGVYGTPPALPGDLHPGTLDPYTPGTNGSPVYSVYYLDRTLNNGEAYTVSGNFGVLKNIPPMVPLGYPTYSSPAFTDPCVRYTVTPIPSSTSSSFQERSTSSRSSFSSMSSSSSSESSSSSFVVGPANYVMAAPPASPPKIFHSVNGVHWDETSVAAGHPNNEIVSMSWNEALGLWFYIMYGGGYIASSPDGITWTALPTLPEATPAYSGIIVLNSGTMFVQANSNSGNIYKSTDGGLTWTALPTPPWSGYFLFTMSTDGFNLVAVTQYYILFVTTSVIFWKSTDEGVTWTNPGQITGAPYAMTVRDLAYGNGTWVVVGGGSSIDLGANLYSSTDLATWTKHTTPAWSSNILKAIYGNGIWMICGGSGDYGHVRISTDLDTWVGDGNLFPGQEASAIAFASNIGVFTIATGNAVSGLIYHTVGDGVYTPTAVSAGLALSNGIWIGYGSYAGKGNPYVPPIQLSTSSSSSNSDLSSISSNSSSSNSSSSNSSSSNSSVSQSSVSDNSSSSLSSNSPSSQSSRSDSSSSNSSSSNSSSSNSSSSNSSSSNSSSSNSSSSKSSSSSSHPVTGPDVVAIAGGNSAANNKRLLSDGTWETFALTSSGIAEAVWTGTKWCAVGNSNDVFTSPDGRSWTSVTTLSGGGMNYMSADPITQVVAVILESNVVRVSTDGGTTWDANGYTPFAGISLGNENHTFVFGNRIFVTAESGGGLAYLAWADVGSLPSPGTGWNQVALAGGIPSEVTSHNGILYATGGTSGSQAIIYQSTDNGVTWTAITSNMPADGGTAYSIIWSDTLGCFLVGRAVSPYVLQSQDLATWGALGTGLVGVADGLCDVNGSVYATQRGSGIFKLNVSTSTWAVDQTGEANFTLDPKPLPWMGFWTFDNSGAPNIVTRGSLYLVDALNAAVGGNPLLTYNAAEGVNGNPANLGALGATTTATALQRNNTGRPGGGTFTSFSMMFWMRTTETPSTGFNDLFMRLTQNSDSSGISLIIYADGVYFFSPNNGPYAPITFVGDGLWHSYVWNFTGNAISVYVDGVLANTASLAVPAQPANYAMLENRRVNSGVRWFDNFGVLMRPMTAAEIAAFANGTIPS
jgi:hypothetical protein